MYGQLIPCGGGQPIVLSRQKMVLRLRGPSSPDAEAPAPFRIKLNYSDGCWSVTVMAGGPQITINGVPCSNGQLMPYDLFAIGRHRFRVSYDAVESPPKRPLPRRVEAPKPAGVAVLGMLVPCGGGRAMPLRKPHIVVGRLPACNVVLLHQNVSSRHCELQWKQGHWQATDLDSENGTFVDGARYHLKWILPGSILGIANHRFRMEYFAQGESPPADDDVPFLSHRPLVASVGLTPQQLDRLPEPHDEPVSERICIDADLINDVDGTDLMDDVDDTL
jgi:hypothetical protein